MPTPFDRIGPAGRRWFTSSTSLTVDTSTQTLRGRYFWELWFNYDNSTNSAALEQDYQLHVTKKVDYKSWLKDNFNVTSGFTYNNEVSASIKYADITGGAKADWSYHIEVANSIEKYTETGTEDTYDYTDTKKYTIGAHSKLSMYRLCYEADNVVYQTDIVSTNSTDDIIVDISYTCTRSLPGLPDILYQFSHTFPRASNTAEWATIRNSIVSSADKSAFLQFHDFVVTLGGIRPLRDNIGEWAAIRDTCSQILQSLGTEDYLDLFKKLLYRFSVTKPQRDNIQEWNAINALSDNILSGLKTIF